MVQSQILSPRVTQSSTPGEPPPDESPRVVTGLPAASAPVASLLSFPVCRGDGQPFTTLAELEAVIASEPAGQFVLGANRSWHGGIHLSERSVPHHKEKYPLRCMMDGTVVAYRLNRSYPRQEWRGNSLAYSTGFCLIRHDYCSASRHSGSTHTATPSAGDGDAAGDCNRLRFYSLYMHLADYQSYQPTVANERIVRLKQRLYVREGEDLQRRLGKLGADSIITLLDAPSTSLVIVESTSSGPRERTLRFIKGRVSQKARGSQRRVGLHQEVWVADCDEYVEHQEISQQVGGRAMPAYWSSRVVATLRNPSAIYRTAQALQSDDSLEGRLQVGSRVQFDRLVQRQILLAGRPTMIAPCRVLEGVSGSSTEPVTGLVWLTINDHLLEQQPLPPEQFDQIVECQIPIRAGEAIGFLGRHQAPAEPLALGHYSDEYRVHIELFSDDQEEALLHLLGNQAGLTHGASFVRLRGDELLFDKRQQDSGCQFSERGQCPDPDQLVAIRKRELDGQGVSWCELDTVRSGFASLHDVYVREQEVSPISQFDLARLGFAIVDGGFDGGEIVLQPSATPTLFANICQQLDRNQDGSVGAAEVAAALRDPAHREQLHKCIIKHPSEWSPAWRQQVAGHLQRLKQQALTRGAAGDPLQQALVLEEQRLSQLALDHFTAPLYFFHPLMLINQLMPVVSQSVLVVLEMLSVLVPGIERHDCSLLLRYLNEYMQAYEINTPLRICHFLAQVAHESKFQPRAENLNYSPRRMREIYGCRRGPSQYDASQDDCRQGRLSTRNGLWSNSDSYAHNPEHLGNLVYSNRMGNGAESSGNGYKFRGRGLIQLTGMENYTAFTTDHNRRFSSNPKDFIEEPDLLATDLEIAVESACFYWVHYQINAAADRDDIEAATTIINNGLNGIDDRRRKLSTIKRYLNIGV